MAIPSSYTTANNYFEDAIAFLKNYSWLYNYPNTQILTKNILNNFPQEWIDYINNLSNEEFNSLSLGIYNETCPETLKLFLEKINVLKPDINVTELPRSSFKSNKNIKLCEKKKHEVICLASLIHDICQKDGIEFIVDVGSGRGYLSEYLHSKYKYKVLGIEGCKIKLDLAEKYLISVNNESVNNVKYAQHFINEFSQEEIIRLLEKYFPESTDKKICIVGLHACADLSVTILNLFKNIDCAKTLVIMPCCYHRLELISDNMEREIFKHFPSSELLKAIFKIKDGDTFLRRPFLRVACQQTNEIFCKMTKAEHEIHARNCLFRAVLEEVAVEANVKISRSKRKSGIPLKSTEDFSFESYLHRLSYTHMFLSEVDGVIENHLMDDIFKQKLTDKYNQRKVNCFLVEVLSCFQAAIQGICENVVLLDRVVFLREKGLQCSVHKVTDDRISPRCYALVARKQ